MNRKVEKQNDLDFEVRFYEGVVGKSNTFIEALMALGDLYTKKGDYLKGFEVDKKLALMRPEDPLVFYNLACSLSLLGRVDEALEAIKKAIARGYNDFAYLLKDRDLVKLHRDERFRAYLSRLAQRKKPTSQKS